MIKDILDLDDNGGIWSSWNINSWWRRINL